MQDGGSLSLLVPAGGGRGKWLYRGRKAGSQTLIDLVCGYAPETGLSAARAKRDEFKLLLRQGINPNEQKRQAIAEARRQEREAGLTFLAVAAEYFRKRAAEGVTAKTLQTDRGRIANHVAPLIGSTPIARIARQDLKPIIDRLAAQNTYTQAGRVAGLVERVFSFAVDAGYIQGTPAEHLGRLVPKQLRAAQKHHAAVTTSAGAAALFRRLWAYMESGRSGRTWWRP